MSIFDIPKTKCAVCGTQIDAATKNTHVGKYYCPKHLIAAQQESARVKAEFEVRFSAEAAEREAKRQLALDEQTTRLAQYHEEDEKRAAVNAVAKLHPSEKQVQFIHTLISSLVTNYETKLEKYRQTNPVYADAYQEDKVYADLLRFIGNVFADELTMKEASTLIDCLKRVSSAAAAGKDIERFFPKLVDQFVATKK